MNYKNWFWWAGLTMAALMFLLTVFDKIAMVIILILIWQLRIELYDKGVVQ